ncbi:cytochrome c biogenesis protein ResB [Kiritimatiellaeota bacterium B1221]|nr:cytochrome c biogenesis protein ResB [Kiritimatiellaeota bacterium B1221]
MKKFMLLASIRLTVACLFWLTVLTFWGTIYQVDHGIYQAQDRFFNSMFFLVGFVPIPGGMLTMGLLFFNLLFSFFVHYQAGWRMPGLMLIHIGLMMMLLGGFFTKVTGIEANVSLFEGEGRNAAISLTEWEISYSDELHSVQKYQAVDLDDLKRGREFSFMTMEEDTDPEEEVRFEVLEVLDHARGLRPDPSVEASGLSPANSAGFVALEELEKLKNPESLEPGVRLKVSGVKGVEEIVLTPRDQRPLGLELDDGSGRFLMLRKKRYELPLFMELNDFSRSYYPGTETPSDYRSMITVHLSEDMQRHVVIKMNEPFRLNGWTFFQQSFAVTDDSEMSVFAVTRNFGRLIPYWATGITSVGLAMHFLQMQWMQLARKRRRKS